MKRVSNRIFILFSLFGSFFVTSCEYADMIEYSPHVTNVSDKYKNQNAKNINRIQNNGTDKPLRIAVIADSHYYYDDLSAVVSRINAIDDVDFTVVVGDITYKGLLSEYERTLEILNDLEKPFIVNIGNHECLGNGREIYAKMFGSENFSFTVGKTRLSFLNLNVWECEISDISFIEKYMIGDETVKIVFSHTPPDDDFITSSQRALYGDILQRNGVMLSVHGHVHSYCWVEDFDDKDFDYLRVDDVDDRFVSIIDIDESGEFEVTNAYY